MECLISPLRIRVVGPLPNGGTKAWCYSPRDGPVASVAHEFDWKKLHPITKVGVKNEARFKPPPRGNQGTKGTECTELLPFAGFVKEKKRILISATSGRGKLVQKDTVTSFGNLISDPPSYEFLYISKHGNVWVPGRWNSWTVPIF